MPKKKDKQDRDGKSESLTKRLQDTIKRDSLALRSPRLLRREVIQEYTGSFYSSDITTDASTSGSGSKKDVVPIALLNMMIDTHTRQLVTNNPRTLVTTRKGEYKGDAVTLGLAVDRDIERMKFSRMLSDVIKDAMFGLGIVCTYVASSSAGDSVSSRVDYDDFICDTDSRRFDECYYLGHKMRVPLDWAKDNPDFDKTERAKLRATENFTRHPVTGELRVESIGKDEYERSGNHFVEQVDIWVLYLRLTNEIVMLPVREGGGILYQKKWKGPNSPTGPYKLLGFQWVPDNLMPLPPVANLRDIARVCNDLLYKVTEQARRQKTILAAVRQSHKDAERIRKGKDGDIIAVDHTLKGNVEEFSTGGVDQATLGVFLTLKEIFSWLAGNLNLQAGLGPQADTATQDRMALQSSSGLIRGMGDTVDDFVTEIIEQIAWYRWNDPLNEIWVTKRNAAADIEIPAVFSPETRGGELEDYDFSIVQYSMQRLTPPEKAQQLLMLWERIVLPSIPFAQGTVQPKVAEFVAKMAQYQGIAADADDIVETGLPPVTLPTPGEGPGKPPVSQRTTVRINKSTKTEEGQNRLLANTLMGGTVQPKEQAGMFGQ